MKRALTLLAALLLTPPADCSAADGNDHLAPHQRVILESKSPPPVEAKFSFDAPAGP